MDRADNTAGENRLEWTVSPWQANWKRPALAMATCVILAFLAGFSVNYPNYSIEPLPEDGIMAPEDDLDRQAELEAYRENWVGRAVTWSGFGLLLLLGMTASIYLPVRYRLDDNGVTTFFLAVPTTRPWGHYRNYYLHDTGIHLTTLPAPSALDPFRGHYIQFADNRDEVKEFIASRIKRPG